jgi:ribonucleotide reductase alpha subunit
MCVIKRDGTREPVSFDKVLERIRRAAIGLSVDYTRLAQLVLAEIHDGVHTTDLDELAARLAISYMSVNPAWGTLAAQIIISNCQRSAPRTFTDAMDLLADVVDARGAPAPALAADVLSFIRTHADTLNAMVDPTRDFALDYFGFKTLEKGYLMRGPAKRIAETPQYMWLRVAVGIWGCSHADASADAIPTPIRLERIRTTYDLMSRKAFTHATPTLFNSGTPRPQCSSCFLLAMKDDSIEGIFDTLKECAQISKYAGGIGLHVHNIRASGTPIAGTFGTSNGLIPMLRVFNNTARYVDQGGGKRNGSFAIYLEPWHADVQSFLKLKSNTGSEEERARDLFYAMWIPDLFMRRVEAGGDWSLFCPHEAPGLADVHGAEFDALYTRYEAEGRARRTVQAQKLWSDILVSQIETGTPYLLYKDAANAKSNQKNLGTIKSSNLCVAPETYILTDNGYRRIASLEGQAVNVWNGDRWSETTVIKTGVRQKLLKVTIRLEHNSMIMPSDRALVEIRTLYCTPYHKFILPTHDLIAECERIDAKDLSPDQKLKCFITNTDNYEKRVEPTVVSVEDYGRYDDTYCFNEPINHAGVFNGILTGNCTEILEYSSPTETAVCNLASIALPHFITTTTPPTFDFDALRDVVATIVRNLNRVIDINFYPTPETKRSNFRHRPVGLGVQGLADVFALLGLAWETPEAALLNRQIFEHIYYAAIRASAVLAAEDGPYETYAGSPASAGLLQPDLWSLPPADYATASELDWTGIRTKVATHGLRNSLLVAPMPTASTSQILGYNECIEPFTSNLYTRRTLAGEFVVVNRHLVADLQALGLWSTDLKDRIVAANGSVQGLTEVPAEIKARYKTVWEIKQKTLIDLAADRGTFICQSQSLNLFIQDPTIAKLSSMHFYAWKKGLKTGMYYLRTKSAVQAIKFTVDPRLLAAQSGGGAAAATGTGEPAECLLCSA